MSGKNREKYQKVIVSSQITIKRKYNLKKEAEKLGPISYIRITLLFINLFWLLFTQTHMKNVRNLLQEQGTTFSNMYTTTPLCCPSRASILTGLFFLFSLIYLVKGKSSSMIWYTEWNTTGSTRKWYLGFLKFLFLCQYFWNFWHEIRKCSPEPPPHLIKMPWSAEYITLSK